MKRTMATALGALVVASGFGLFAMAEKNDDAKQWAVHDENRPHPQVITPGTFPTPEQAGKAPSDALVLFDGKDLSHFEATGGGEPTYKVESGYFEVAGKKEMQTKEGYGSCQIHVEWASPKEVKGTSQGRGNSGIYIMGRYEAQVLDSYENVTYADGQAAALYGQFPPLVNASLPPGQWQTYDIVFHRPQFDADGKVLKPATMTIFHNGVLVQDHRELRGTTAHHSPGKYEKHADKEPLRIQNHGNPVRFRSLWIRQLED